VNGRWRSHLVAAFIIVTLLIGILGQYNLWRQIGRPFPGFLSYTNLHGGYWTIAENTPPWWSGIRDTGLQYSDRIIKLDGQPFGVDQATVFQQAYQANLPVTLTIARQGAEVTLATAVIPFSLAHFLEIKTTHIIIGLGFWLLALAIFSTRPHEPLNQIFAAASCLLAINQWLWLRFLFHLEPHPLSNLLDLFVLLFYTFFASTLAHAALLFPPVSRWAHPLTFRLLYSHTPFFMLIFVTRRLYLWQGIPVPVWFSQLEQLTFHAAQLLGVMAALFFALRLLRLAYQQHKARLPMFRYHILLLGFLPPILYIVRTVVASVGGANFSSWQYLIDWRYALLAGPLAIAFVIIRYQTFQNSNQIILVVFALSASALCASLGSAALRQAYPQLVVTTNTIPIFVPLFAILFLFSIGWLYLSAPTGIAGRLLHREARQYGDVKLFGQSVLGQTSLSKLPQQIIQSLRALNIEQAAIWLREKDGVTYHLAAQSGQWERPLPSQLSIPFVTTMQPGQVLRVGEPDYSLPAGLHDLRPYPAFKLIGCLGHDSLIGILGLGTRWDEEIYTNRDLEIIELVVQQTSLFLLTAVQIDELRQVPNRIMRAQEKERLTIARELHDTIQQFLGRLPFRLAVSRQHLPIRPDKSDQILQECIEDISEAALTLRQIRGNLSPALTETSLAQSLPMLTGQFQRRTGVSVTLHLPAQVDEILTVNGRHALYRVMQQALDNVEAHAHATTVHISLQLTHDRLTFIITDNGVGFSNKTRKHAEANGSFGLQSMETRIKSQEGDVVFLTDPTQGTVIRGWLPVQETHYNQRDEQSLDDYHKGNYRQELGNYDEPVG
jgi:signal transduction histidine kinase